MKCPTCITPDLLMTERLGIEIDYCPQCRGVWLDRGELDKIIERSLRDATPVAMAQPAVSPMPPQYDNRHGYRENHHDGHHDYRGKKSIWKELFD
jgi:Zn-finger nucleic acid-binding protein